MSSKILRGAAKSIQAPLWQSVDREPRLPEPRAEAPPAEREDSAIAKVQSLEVKLAEMELEMVRNAETARASGFMEGEARAKASVEPVIQQLTRSIQDLAGYRARFRKEAEQDLVKLSISIARKILHRELAIDENAILALVRVVLESIDAREVHRVRLHPTDATVVQKFLSAMGAPQQLAVTADTALERGAVIFETARGNLDASIQTQLAEIERGFADLGSVSK